VGCTAAIRIQGQGNKVVKRWEASSIVVSGLFQVTGVDLQTGNEEPKKDEGDVVAHRFGSVLREKIRASTPDGLIDKPIRPAVLVDQIQSLLS
jgi:hypothetical protein